MLNLALVYGSVFAAFLTVVSCYTRKHADAEQRLAILEGLTDALTVCRAELADEQQERGDFEASQAALLAEKAAALAREQAVREGLSLAVELLDDAWNQFAIDGKNGKWAGGLSTLEWLEAELPKLRVLAGQPANEERGT